MENIDIIKIIDKFLPADSFGTPRDAVRDEMYKDISRLIINHSDLSNVSNGECKYKCLSYTKECGISACVVTVGETEDSPYTCPYMAKEDAEWIKIE
ncbi:hypothetical protein OAT93_01590 [bacterium]|nr:hypothetical protein [bacterium]